MARISLPGNARLAFPVRQLRWAILVFDLDPTTGHEQGGERRALVVSYDAFHRSTLATICPITAARSAPTYPNEVAIPSGEGGQTKDGVILCHQVRTVSLERVTGGSPRIVGYVTKPEIRSAVREALGVHLGLDIPSHADGGIGSAQYR